MWVRGWFVHHQLVDRPTGRLCQLVDRANRCQLVDQLTFTLTLSTSWNCRPVDRNLALSTSWQSTNLPVDELVVDESPPHRNVPMTLKRCLPHSDITSSITIQRKKIDTHFYKIIDLHNLGLQICNFNQFNVNSIIHKQITRWVHLSRLKKSLHIFYIKTNSNKVPYTWNWNGAAPLDFVNFDLEFFDHLPLRPGVKPLDRVPLVISLISFPGAGPACRGPHDRQGQLFGGLLALWSVFVSLVLTKFLSFYLSIYCQPLSP